MKVILTIAGSDSGAGAGIQADIKAIHAQGAYAVTAITAITAQNTQGVRAVHAVPPEVVTAQLAALHDDFPIAAAKTGMLFDPAVIGVVAEFLAARHRGPLVVDPVMVSTSGHRLLAPEAERVLVARLCPLATLLTPNIPEAEALWGQPVRSVADMEAAARALCERGAAAVLVKGGHQDADEIVDVLCDGEGTRRYARARIDSRNTHGTGCTLSAALAALLGQGLALRAAVAQAGDYVAGAIRNGPPLGRGHGPTDHFWRSHPRS